MLNGVPQKPIEGISFAYTFGDAEAKGQRTTQYFEMGVNRGFYQDGWMASALSFPPWQSVRGAFDPDKQKWELYHIDEDFSQAKDLAATNPRNCASCRISGGYKLRATMSFRSIGVPPNGSTPS